MRNRVRKGEATCSDDLLEFKDFLAVLGPKPDPTFTLERKNGKRGYSPANVEWASKEAQSGNRSNTRFLTYEGSKHTSHGEILPLTQWARLTGQNASTIRRRLSDGWSDTEAIDGVRLSKPRTFQAMSVNQLVHYEPWPEKTAEKDEELYLRNCRSGENRFQFERRYLIARWQSKIDRSAPSTMIRDATMPSNERDHWEEEENLKEAGWILHRDGDEADLTRIANEQRRLNRYLKENRAREKDWLSAIGKHEIPRLKAKVAAGMRRKYVSKPPPPVDTADEDDDQDPGWTLS